MAAQGGYLAAKHADPNCTVILGGLATYFDPNWFGLLRSCDDPNQAERAAHHTSTPLSTYSRMPMPRTHPPHPVLLSAHGLSKPIWYRVGVPVKRLSRPNGRFFKSPTGHHREQASYIQTHAYAYPPGESPAAR